MTPETLSQKLIEGLLPQGYSTTNIEDTGYYLSALLDLGQADSGQRRKLFESFEGRIYPLIQDPDFAEAAPFCGNLIAARATDLQSQSELIYELDHYNTDIVSAWISSTLTTPRLADHLAQAAFVYDGNKKRYLFRYYDPFLIPIVYGEAPEIWQQWFFAPIHSWWFPKANSQEVIWHQLIGRMQKSFNQPAPELIMDDAFQAALTRDPQTYKILTQLEEKNTPFQSDCRNVRFAKISDLVQRANRLGFTKLDDIFCYVERSLNTPLESRISAQLWTRILDAVINRNGGLDNVLSQFR